jgi:hypothetical protein
MIFYNCFIRQIKMSHNTLLQNLGLPTFSGKIPEESPFELSDIQINETTPNQKYTISLNSNIWYLDTKVVLDEKNLRAACCIAARFAPPGSIVELQADTHAAGPIFVGMIMSFDKTRIPISLVSGDIGCGLTVIPMMTKYGQDKTPFTEPQLCYILGVIRQVLKRGKVADEGTTFNEYMNEAVEFYDSGELSHWLDEMKYILETTGVEKFANCSQISRKNKKMCHNTEEDEEDEEDEDKQRELHNKIRQRSYELFCKEQTDKIIAKYKDDCIKKDCSDLWKQMSDEEKYLEQEDKSKAYSLFFEKKSVEFKTKEYQELTDSLVKTTCNKLWKNISKSEKERFVTLATMECQQEESDDEKEVDEKIDSKLTSTQLYVLKYIGKFAQSLGSSGNHFMEVARDENGYNWIVIHSGSRALGAKVYQVIADACRSLTNGIEVATDNLAKFYTRVYDALNKFARFNRVVCAISVLKELGYEYGASLLKNGMAMSDIFRPAIEKSGNENDCMLSLISGLTHNGIKAFINDDTKEVMYVLSKGAVAMSKRASSSIVALRAGEGCYVWTMVDLNCMWKEVDMKTASDKNYTIVHKADGVIYSGHGAGRSRATNKTAKMSTFEDICSFCEDNHFVSNYAPGLLGDNPQIAYNDVATVVKFLPLDIACTKSWLKTVVAYKEGMDHNFKYIKTCSEYIEKNWYLVPRYKRLLYDINLCQANLSLFKTYTKEREKILEACKDLYVKPIYVEKALRLESFLTER